MNTLSELPLSIIKPESPEGEPELPVPSSISWSSIVVLVALLVTTRLVSYARLMGKKSR